MQIATTKNFLVLLTLVGTTLQFYITLIHSSAAFSAFSVFRLFLSLSPYLLCLLIAYKFNRALPALLVCMVVLLIDFYTYYLVFVKPTSSTAALQLLMSPIISLILVAPVTVYAVFKSR